ncbi:MAG: hypothetical protein JWR87_123 [Segetibacter sp.]|jgi:hypothetical protein|nr:hypothetical protein [Segetibacter sp.]
MASVKCFEDIEAWKIARTICNKMGALIDDDRFQKKLQNYRSA